MISLDNLQLVKSIAKYGSISHASKIVHISTSSLSRALHEVENDLGIKIFDRNGRHLKLNPYGKILLHYIDLAESSMEKTLDSIYELRERKEKLLRVYFCHSLGNTSAVLAPFIRMNRDVKLDIILSSKEAEDKGYDLKFVSSKEKIESPNALLIAEENYIVVAHKDHYLPNRSAISMADLQHETFIVPPIGQGGNLLKDLCHEYGFSPYKKIDCPQVWGALHYVEQNMGILVAPELSMMAGFDSDSVVKVPLVTFDKTRPAGTRYIYLIWANDYEPTNNALLFANYLAEFF